MRIVSLDRLKRLWIRLCYRPISIFVFHNVSDALDPLICVEDDWTQINQFKHNIMELQNKYKFISLSVAYNKLKYDRFRLRSYAVLTTDDGLSSVLHVISWLEARNIPLTIFVNSGFMKCNRLKPIHIDRLRRGDPNVDIQSIATKMYMSEEQIYSLNTSLIEIGMHGHEHLDVSVISDSDFDKEVTRNYEALRAHPRFIKSYAYPWGKFTNSSITYLQQRNIIPILVDGKKNYIFNGKLSRECIDNIKITR